MVVAYFMAGLLFRDAALRDHKPSARVTGTTAEVRTAPPD
jgi:hypothetical protein